MGLIHRGACLSALAAMSAFSAIPSVADEDLPAQIEAIRADVIKLMEGTRVSDADIAMSIPLAPVSKALAALNAAPPSQRTINVNSTGANGFFWKDDPTWCGSFAELGGNDGLQATVA